MPVLAAFLVHIFLKKFSISSFVIFGWHICKIITDICRNLIKVEFYFLLLAFFFKNTCQVLKRCHVTVT